MLSRIVLYSEDVENLVGITRERYADPDEKYARHDDRRDAENSQNRAVLATKK